MSQTEALDGSRELPPHLANPFEMKDVVGAGVAYEQLVEKAKRDGVRVRTTGAGRPSAGCVQPVEARVSQQVQGKRAGDPAIRVAVRFEVLINDSLSATERLATLTHELGHLYCGHVGAERSDPWADRCPEHKICEFEAESVAILTFRRLAPDATVPTYLDQYFTPGQGVPEEAAWDRVVWAASRIVDMCRG